MAATNMCVLPKLKSWEEFEEVVCQCANIKFKKEFIRYGVQGQKQNGIDLISTDREIGIQCKNYSASEGSTAILKSIKSDYSKLFQLPFTIKRYVITTALNRDVRIINEILSMNSEELSVEIMFWEEISELILSNPTIFNRHYSFLSLKNKNYIQLFSFVYFGVQIAELIGLTLGDRHESFKYCSVLKEGVVWIEDQQKANYLRMNIEAIEKFALGSLSFEQIENYERQDAFCWGKNIEDIVIQMLESLDTNAKLYYLAGLYLGFVSRCALKNQTVSQEIYMEFLKTVDQLPIDHEKRGKIYSMSKDLMHQESEKVFSCAAKLYDNLRLII